MRHRAFELWSPVGYGLLASKRCHITSQQPASKARLAMTIRSALLLQLLLFFQFQLSSRCAGLLLWLSLRCGFTSAKALSLSHAVCERLL